MNITIKTDEEIDLMRQSGHLLAKVHDELHEAIRPGISTLELDQIGERTIRALGGIPNCKNYEGFPMGLKTQLIPPAVASFAATRAYFSTRSVFHVLEIANGTGNMV